MLLVSFQTFASDFNCTATVKNGKRILDLTEAISLETHQHSEVTKGLAIEITYPKGDYSIVDEKNLTEVEKDLRIIKQTLERCRKAKIKTM